MSQDIVLVEKCSFCGMAYYGKLPEGFDSTAKAFFELDTVKRLVDNPEQIANLCPHCIINEVKNFNETQTSYLWEDYDECTGRTDSDQATT